MASVFLFDAPAGCFESSGRSLRKSKAAYLIARAKKNYSSI